MNRLCVLVGLGDASHMSSLGNRYLERVQNSLEPRKDTLVQEAGPGLSLLVGAFGITVLAGTPYSIFEEVLKKSDASAAGGCGGGCGGYGGCGGCGGCGG